MVLGGPGRYHGSMETTFSFNKNALNTYHRLFALTSHRLSPWELRLIKLRRQEFNRLCFLLGYSTPSLFDMGVLFRDPVLKDLRDLPRPYRPDTPPVALGNIPAYLAPPPAQGLTQLLKQA